MPGILGLLCSSLEPSSSQAHCISLRKGALNTKKQEEAEAKVLSREHSHLHLAGAARVMGAVTTQWLPAMSQGGQGHTSPPPSRCLRGHILAPSENSL